MSPDSRKGRPDSGPTTSLTCTESTDVRWLGEDASDREKLAWLAGWLVGREGGELAGYDEGYAAGYAAALRDRAAAAEQRALEDAADDAVHRTAVHRLVRFVEVADRRSAHDRGAAA